MAEPTNDPELDNLPVRAEEQGSSDSLPEFASGGQLGPANPSRGYQESAASIATSADISTIEENLGSRIRTALNAPKLMYDSMTPSSVSHALLQEDLKFRSKHNNVLEQEMGLVMKMRNQHQLTKKMNQQDAWTAEATEAVQMLQNSYGGKQSETEVINGLFERNPHWANNPVIMSSFGKITANRMDQTEVEVQRMAEDKLKHEYDAFQNKSPWKHYNAAITKGGGSPVTAEQQRELSRALQTGMDGSSIIGNPDLLISHGIDGYGAGFLNSPGLVSQLADEVKVQWDDDLTTADIMSSMRDLASESVNKAAEGPDHDPEAIAAREKLDRGRFYLRKGATMFEARHEKDIRSAKSQENLKKEGKAERQEWANAQEDIRDGMFDDEGGDIDAEDYYQYGQEVAEGYIENLHVLTNLKLASGMHGGAADSKEDKVTNRKANMIKELLLEDLTLSELEGMSDGQLAAAGHERGLWLDNLSFMELPYAENGSETTGDHKDNLEAWLDGKTKKIPSKRSQGGSGAGGGSERKKNTGAVPNLTPKSREAVTAAVSANQPEGGDPASANSSTMTRLLQKNQE